MLRSPKTPSLHRCMLVIHLSQRCCWLARQQKRDLSMRAFTTLVMAGAICVGASPVLGQAAKDTLTIAQSVDVESLEPHALNASGSINVANHLWVTLLQVTAGGEVQPYLAESYKWNE